MILCALERFWRTIEKSKPTCPRKTKKARVHEVSLVGGKVEELWRKRFVKKTKF